MLFVISRLDSKRAKECKFDRSRRELSNEHSVAKFGFDIAENEYSFLPSENESSKVCRQVVRQLDRLS